MGKRFFVVIDVLDDEWVKEADPNIEVALATWIDGVMSPDVESTVYARLTDLVADNALDALAENG